MTTTVRAGPGPDPAALRIVPATAGRWPDLEECFVVKPGARRRGVATNLLSGAVELAQRAGASVIEAYPVDLAAGPMPARAVVRLYLQDVGGQR